MTAIEMDVALTSDGVVLLSHDPILDPVLTRDAHAQWIAHPGTLLRDLTYDQASGYDVGRIRPGSAQADRFPQQQGLDGVRLPRLADVLALHPLAHLSIELKTFPDHPGWTVSAKEMAEAVLAVLDQAGAADRARIISFDWRGLRYLRGVRPGLSLGYLTDAETLAAARLWWDGPAPEDFGGSVARAVAAEGGTIWGPDFATLMRPEVEEARGLGLLVNPWTVNEPADMARLIDWGVGGLTTDYPDRARAVMVGAPYRLSVGT